MTKDGNHGDIIKCLYWKRLQKKKKRKKAQENPMSKGIVYILAMVNWIRLGYLCYYRFNDECHTNHFDSKRKFKVICAYLMGLSDNSRLVIIYLSTVCIYRNIW